jgi:hypothetical protein
MRGFFAWQFPVNSGAGKAGVRSDLTVPAGWITGDDPEEIRRSLLIVATLNEPPGAIKSANI